MTSPMWHYTCDHGAAGISSEGLVRPNRHHLLGCAVAWFTDLDPAYRDQLGLTSTTLKCDRMRFRFAVDPGQVVWWPKAVRLLHVPQSVRTELETGRLPAHWWVSLEPVPVLASVTLGEVR